MSLPLFPYLVNQYFDDNGVPLAGGILYFYEAGVGNTTPAITYIDAAGSTPNTNPITLNSAGRPTNGSGNPCGIWLLPTQSYRVLLTNGNHDVIWDQPQYDPIGGSASGAVITYENIAEMRADTTVRADGDIAFVSGYTEDGDGGGGLFWYQADSASGDNAGTIIKQTSNSSTGRWFRYIDKYINVKWFGAKGDDTTNATTAFTAAAAFAIAIPSEYGLPSALPLYASGGTYLFVSSPGITNIPIVLDHAAVLHPQAFYLSCCPIINDKEQHFKIDTEDSSAYIVFVNTTSGGYYNATAEKTIYPEWFGAKGDGTTDDSAAINLCYKTGVAITVKLTSTDGYYVSNMLTPSSFSETKGVRRLTAHAQTIISDPGLSHVFGDNGVHLSDIVLKDICISGSLTTSLCFTASTQVVIDNVVDSVKGFTLYGADLIVKNCNTGGSIAATSCLNASFKNNTVTGDIVVITTLVASFENNVIDGNIVHSGGGIAVGNLMGGTISTSGTASTFIVRGNSPDSVNDDYLWVINDSVTTGNGWTLSGGYYYKIITLPAVWSTAMSKLILTGMVQSGSAANIWYPLGSVTSGAAGSWGMFKYTENTVTLYVVDTWYGGTIKAEIRKAY